MAGCPLGEAQRARTAHVPDPAGTVQLGEDPGDPGQNRVRPERRGHLGRRVDPVLDRHHGGRPAHQRGQRRDRDRQLPGLDAQQHDIHRTQAGRIIAGPDRINHEVAGHAAHHQPVASQRRQVFPAGHEADVVPGHRQPPAEIPTGTARTDDRYSHRSILTGQSHQRFAAAGRGSAAALP